MFNRRPLVQIDITVNVMEYDTSAPEPIIKRSCHFDLHVKKTTCVEEAFDETFHHAKELLDTAMKEGKKE